MKRIATLSFLLLTLVAAAGASETNWRILVQADNGNGMYHGGGFWPGVYPTSTDGIDAQDQDYHFSLDTSGLTAVVLSSIAGQSNAFAKSIKAPSIPTKYWEVYVAAGHNATYSQIRLNAYTIANYPETLPPSQYQGTPVGYRLVMVDNRGVAGAPANGTIWELPIPTSVSADPFWTSPVNLPTIVMSEPSADALFSEGYHLQFVQEFVPEPSSLLALGTCLCGLAGCALLRRSG